MDEQFKSWLLNSQDIDIQSIEPDMEASLLRRFEAEQEATPKRVLLIPIDCSWPTRGYWQAN